METKKRWHFKVPHTYVLLFFMVVLCGIMAWIIPAGEYDRIKDVATGATVVDPASFHFTGGGGIGFFEVMLEFIKGMESASNIIFLIFILGGSFMILQDTNALSAGVHAMAKKYGKRQNIILLMVMFLFSILGGTIGMAEEVIVFIPILVVLCKELKLDRMVALAVVMVGARIGFTTGLINPFTVGVAQGIAGLPLYSGLGYRLIWYAVLLIVTGWYIIRYVNKIRDDPTSSIMYGVEVEGDEDTEEIIDIKLDGRKIVIIVGFFGTIIFMVFGVFTWGWYMEEIATVFLILGIAGGIVAGMGGNEIAKSFVKGTMTMAFAALVVGIAKAILLTMQDAGIVDTVIFYASGALSGLPKFVAAEGMYVFQLLLNFLIPSGSGQAMATMPIMAPLADTLGITRQTAVLAFHYGDGFTNLIAPTLGSLMAAVAVSKVPFDRYIKWIAPLCLIWMVVGFASVAIATIIGYGPF
ncbi:MAG: YfcC family protein [Peptostreptococcaceae bacterium]|nr:YfcC family protein [Peptostreptococcaceae bacterium]